MANSLRLGPFIAAIPIVAAALSTWSCASSDGGGAAPDPIASQRSALVAPEKSGIQHVVVLMMENRSFDHLLGWVPGADGKQAGLAYPDPNGVLVPTHPLAPDYQGCGHPDPDHSYSGGRIQYDGGACDGWLKDTNNDPFAIGYYGSGDLPFFSRAVGRFQVFDRYFAALMAPTYPNRIFQHAAQTDRLDDTIAISALPTIWDRLAEHGVSGRYYYSDVPFLAMWGPKYLPISRPVLDFVDDALSGNLPQVSFVDPRFLGEDQGISGDDHPKADIRNGEAFLNLIYTAVVRSPQWRSTVLVINYDEWGGFFDHVPPPTAPIPPADAIAGDTDGRLGFRTAAMVVAPWATPGSVSHEQLDHTSVLRMIEWRWGLEPLTVRDATANNLADTLDFTRRNAPAPLFPVRVGPYGGVCPGTATSTTSGAESSLGDLVTLATTAGFPIVATTEAELAAEEAKFLGTDD